jgi:hypothetical protein
MAVSIPKSITRWTLRRLPLDPQFSDKDKKEKEYYSVPWIMARTYAIFLFAMFTVEGYQKILGENASQATGLHYLDIFFSIPSLMGAFAFAYRKEIFWPMFWRIYLPLICVWDLWGSLWFVESTHSEVAFVSGGWMSFLSQYMLLFPLYVMLFKLAFPRKNP